jgi:L-amino acid N-acyltransferase YncA
LCVDSPQSLNRALLFKAFEIPFVQWNFTYLAGIIQASNTASLNIAKRLGFSEIGRIPGQLHFFVMYKGDCRWLRA